MADNKDMMMLQQQNPFPFAHRLPSSPLPHHLSHNFSLHKRKPLDTAAITSSTATTTATTTPHPSTTPPPSGPVPPSLPPPSSSNISKHKKKLLKVILKLPKPHPHHLSPLPSDHASPPSSSPSRSLNSSSDTPSLSTPPRPSIPPHQQPQQHLFERHQQHQQHQHQQQQRLLQQQHYQQQQLLLQQQQQLKIQLDLKLQQQQQQQLKLQQHHPELLQQLKLQQQQQQLNPRLEDPKRPKVQLQQEVQQSSNSPKRAKCQQPAKLPPQRPSLQIPQPLKKLSQNPTSESRNQYGLSPTALTGKVPSLPNPSFVPPPPLSAPLSSPPSFAATPTIDGADPGQKHSKKRKLKAVVDSLGSESHTSTATKVATRQKLPLDGSTLSARSLLSASSTESHVQQPQPEGNVLNDRDVPGLSSKLLSDSQVLLPVPSKKLLEGILDKLQKKDTYGVFSEPVDPKLVPDYYDFIKEPMDFGTMRTRIASGYYTSLEPFQGDIFLVCNNAMRYNARDTIYYKQARSIQDAMRRILEALRTAGPQFEIDELVPKQKPSQIKKPLKKHDGNSWFERTASDRMSGVTLATRGDQGGKFAFQGHSGAAGWNLERQLGNVLSTSRLSLSPSDARADNNEDLPGSLVKSLVLKDGRRAHVSEENRRSTYRSQTMSANGVASVLTGAGGDHQLLVPTGYQFDFPYARSLARFAADLGPAVWKIAAEKIRMALPPGFPFGPGWVGEREVPGGAFIAPVNKPQSHLQPSIQSKALKPPIENRLQTGDVPSNRESLLKGDLTGAGASLRACSSSSLLSVDINNSPCQQSESKAPTSTAVPTHGNSELLEHAKVSHQSRPNLRNMSHSKTPAHNEPNQNRSASWSAGKQPEKGTIPAELPLSFPETYVGEKLRDEHEVNETVKSKIGIRMSSGMATCSAPVKQGSYVGSNQSFRPSQPLANEDRFLDQSLLNSGSPRNLQRPQQSSHAGPGAPSVNFSSALSHSSGTSRVQEDGNMHGWVQTQQSDLSQVVGNACLKVPSQLPGNSLQCQPMGLVQYTQLQDGLAKVGLQAGVVSQHGNNFSSNMPHFLQQQFTPDVHSFSQQQQMRLHPHGSSKPATKQLGGCVDSHRSSLLKHSSFPTQIGTGISQSQNQAWQYAAPQFVLQGPELPFSVAPDLNASIQSTKSHFDNSTGSELQQPDLALQL